MSLIYDTVVIGGGPAGSTVASLLRRYDPEHRVLVLERETFPRDHVGESQLPLIGVILDEMGVWEKVEAAGFPIKVGATYRWGASDDLWHFNFVPNGELTEEARPARYRGQRTATAFQVDRAVYDEILLDHAASLGAEVRQNTKVARVETEGDAVTGLVLADGSRVEARRYVDATGGAGLFRRAFAIETDSPTSLRNIAIWDYWQNAEWAEEIGVGGTRVQVMSLGYGWIWFIPLGPTRTSVGFICPASYYKASGMRPGEIYAKALAEEPRIAGLLANAESEGKLASTNDWSYVASRMAGENWFLAGDSCGFADPILAAGMTLAHAGAREVAYTILESDRGEIAPEWLRASYDEGHRRRIRQHIRFADYWYSANGVFTDLKEETARIASDAGLDLDPDRAFQWLGTGGFANDDGLSAAIGTFSVAAVKQLGTFLGEGDVTWEISKYGEFRLDLAGATERPFALLENGRVRQVRAYERGGKRLPVLGPYAMILGALAREREWPRILAYLRSRSEDDLVLLQAVQTLEAMVVEGWVKGKRGKAPAPSLQVERDSPLIQSAVAV